MDSLKQMLKKVIYAVTPSVVKHGQSEIERAQSVARETERLAWQSKKPRLT